MSWLTTSFILLCLMQGLGQIFLSLFYQRDWRVTRLMSMQLRWVCLCRTWQQNNGALLLSGSCALWIFFPIVTETAAELSYNEGPLIVTLAFCCEKGFESCAFCMWALQLDSHILAEFAVNHAHALGVSVRCLKCSACHTVFLPRT